MYFKDHAEYLQKITLLTDRVVNLEQVYVYKTGLTHDGVDLAIHHLRCTKRAAITKYISCDGQQINLIKIVSPNKTVHSITELERSVFDINLSVEKETKKIEDLEEQIQTLDSQIRQLVRDKKTNLAKVKLRLKKALEVKLGN